MEVSGGCVLLLVAYAGYLNIGVLALIFTLEGAPAVGKTTVAKYLEEQHGYYRVPEVNELSPNRPERGYLPWNQSLNFVVAHEKELCQPSIIAHLQVADETRYSREQGREQARGNTNAQFQRKWARYADFPLFQNVMFTAISERFPDWVQTLENTDIAGVHDA